ncbi:DUF3592 domain-containing protein [Thalassolituus sp. LLYu03]|uniref:DUF3592 domain-containing protein n=1 Tax=Thalassolituus sp. LLYu03 TaxID=3421656 RepID=UPI003D275816
MLVEYLTSPFWAAINILITIGFTGLTYDKYAKHWCATTGEFSTTGTFTWSGFGTFISNIDLQQEGLISYSYSVEGRTYNSSLFAGVLTSGIVDRNPKGKKITVFYSPEDPAYSRAEHPPRHLMLVANVVSYYLILPLTLINIPLFFIY